MPELEFLGGNITISDKKEQRPPEQSVQPFDVQRFYSVMDGMSVDERKERLLRLISHNPYRAEYYRYAIERELPGIENIGIIAERYSVNIEDRLNHYMLVNMLREASMFAEKGEGLSDSTLITEQALDELLMKYSVQAIPTSKSKLARLPEEELLRLARKYKAAGENFKVVNNVAFAFIFDMGKLMRTYNGVLYNTAAEAIIASGQVEELKKLVASVDYNDRNALISLKNDIELRNDYDKKAVEFFTRQLEEAIKRVENEKLNSIVEKTNGKRLMAVLAAETEIKMLDYDERLKDVYLRRLRDIKLCCTADIYLYLIKTMNADDCSEVFDELIWLRSKCDNRNTYEYLDRNINILCSRYSQISEGQSLNMTDQISQEGHIDCDDVCRKFSTLQFDELAAIADRGDESLIIVPEGISNPDAYRIFATAAAKIAYAAYNYPKVEMACRDADNLSCEELKKIRTLINDEAEYSTLINDYAQILNSNISKHVSALLETEFESAAAMNAAELSVFKLEIETKMNDLIPQTRHMFEGRFAQLMADAEEADMESRCTGFEMKSRNELAELRTYITNNIKTRAVSDKYIQKINMRLEKLEDDELKLYTSGLDVMNIEGKISLMNGLDSAPYNEMMPHILNKYRSVIYNKIIFDKVRKYYSVCAGVGQSGLYGTVMTGFDGNGMIDRNVQSVCNSLVQFEKFEIPLVVYTQKGVFSGVSGMVITDKNIYVSAKGQITKVSISDHPIINITYKTFNTELWLCVGKNYMQLPCRPAKQQGEAIKNLLNMSIVGIDRINNEN